MVLLLKKKGKIRPALKKHLFSTLIGSINLKSIHQRTIYSMIKRAEINIKYVCLRLPVYIENL